jgi:acetyl-CoA synthetase
MSADNKSARPNITSVLHEERVFPPAKTFSERAHIKSLAQYRKLYNESFKAPKTFWDDPARLAGVLNLVSTSPTTFKAVVATDFARANVLVRTNLSGSIRCAPTPALRLKLRPSGLFYLS